MDYVVINLDNQMSYDLVKDKNTDIFSLTPVEKQGKSYSITPSQASTIVEKGKHRGNTIKLSLKTIIGLDVNKTTPIKKLPISKAKLMPEDSDDGSHFVNEDKNEL